MATPDHSWRASSVSYFDSVVVLGVAQSTRSAVERRCLARALNSPVANNDRHKFMSRVLVGRIHKRRARACAIVSWTVAAIPAYGFRAPTDSSAETWRARFLSDAVEAGGCALNACERLAAP